MREVADDVLEKFSLVLGGASNRSQELILGVEKDLEILDSFFEIAKVQNWVSPSEILEIQEEYSRIMEEFKRVSRLEEVEQVVPEEINADREIESSPFVTTNERQKKILEVLKEKGQAQVGEIKEIFPDVSKRTIRRDFRQMLKMGLIKRIGEKNKTFYTLIA
jgi:DNA-binding HxlR family transcriptional regulator